MAAKLKEVRLDIVPERHKRLKQLAKAEGSSVAVIVRRAINEFLDRNATKDGE
jgi:predicted transcriptional regulator